MHCLKLFFHDISSCMTSELASYEPQWWQNVVSLMKRNINEQQEGRLSRWLSVGALARKPEYWLQISKAHVNVDPPVILVLIWRSKGILEQAGKTENLLQLKRKGEQSKKTLKAREYRCAYTCIYTYMHAYMIIYEHTTHTHTHVEKSQDGFINYEKIPHQCHSICEYCSNVYCVGHRDKRME